MQAGEPERPWEIFAVRTIDGWNVNSGRQSDEQRYARIYHCLALSFLITSHLLTCSIIYKTTSLWTRSAHQ